jgi:hypothetical protein
MGGGWLCYGFRLPGRVVFYRSFLIEKATHRVSTEKFVNFIVENLVDITFLIILRKMARTACDYRAGNFRKFENMVEEVRMFKETIIKS